MDTYRKLQKAIEDLEYELYGESFDCSTSKAAKLFEVAVDLRDYIFSRYDLVYFNPGEPQAEGVVETRSGPRDVRIPLTGLTSDRFYTYEEEEQIMAAGETLTIPIDLYDARIMAQHARDVLEEGWQYGLEGVEPQEDEEWLDVVLKALAELKGE